MRVVDTLKFLRTFKVLKEEAGKDFIDFYDRRGRTRIRVDLAKGTLCKIEGTESEPEIPLKLVSTMRMDIYRRRLHIFNLKGKDQYIIDFSKTYR